MQKQKTTKEKNIKLKHKTDEGRHSHIEYYLDCVVKCLCVSRST